MPLLLLLFGIGIMVFALVLLVVMLLLLASILGKSSGALSSALDNDRGGTSDVSLDLRILLNSW